LIYIYIYIYHKYKITCLYVKCAFRKRRKDNYKLLHELRSQVVHASSSAEGGGERGGGKPRYKLPGPGRPEVGPGPEYIAYVLIFGWSVLDEGAEKLFHGAPNPLSATLTTDT